MDHHLIREIHQREFCPYCRNKMNGDRWESEFHNEAHYKSITCKSCSKKIWLPVEFAGDGYDSWDGHKRVPNSSPLELKLKKAEPRISAIN